MANFSKLKTEVIFVPPAIEMEGRKVTEKVRSAITSAVSKGVIKGLTYVEKGLRPALNSSMDSQWKWGVGKAGAPSRDIVDTGALKSSLQMKTIHSKTQTRLEIIYDKPYAKPVYFGACIRPYGNQNAAIVCLPSRPWIMAVLEGTHGQPKFDYETPINQAIQEAWKAEIG